MSTIKKLLSASVLALALPVAASASTLIETVTFGAKSVTEANGGANIDFNFLTDLSEQISIDKFVITLNVSGVGPEVESGYTTYPTDPIGGLAADGVEETNTNGEETENWFAEIVGGGVVGGVPLGSNSAFWKRLDPSQDPLVPFVFELDATNDTLDTSGIEVGGDRQDGIRNRAFARSVFTDQLRLRFRERSGGDDEFELLSASVEVFGTPAPVPLPASGLLLLGALGGAAAWKRRKKA